MDAIALSVSADGSDVNSPYTPAMDTATITSLVARLTTEEIHDGLWLVGVFEGWGSMSQDEADEWRRRILARQGFLALTDDPFHAS